MRKCPKCGSSNYSSCRCPKSDSTCRDCGYEWHYCLEHKCIVVGRSDHSRPTNECSCVTPNNIEIAAWHPSAKDIVASLPKSIVKDQLPWAVGEILGKGYQIMLKEYEGRTYLMVDKGMFRQR